MKKNVDFIFFVEHKDRELDSVLLIAELLIKKGFSVVVLSVYFHIQYVFKYIAKVYVFPYLIRKDDWPVRQILKMRGKTAIYVNMNWEQLLSPINLEFKKPSDPFVKSTVKHFVWTKHFKEVLINNGVIDKNITITGNVCDYILSKLNKESGHLRENMAKEFKLDLNKEWLFLPMNYGWAFSTDNLVQKKIKNGYPVEAAALYRQYSKDCLSLFADFARSLVDLDRYEIILRPHPSISNEQYNDYFKEKNFINRDNFLISKEYSIREWIISSDIIGSSWSTSVWDAHNIGKKSFLFTPISRPYSLDVWWNEKVLNISQPDEVSLCKSSDEVKNKNYNEIPRAIVDKLVEFSNEIEQKEVTFRVSLFDSLKICKSLLMETGIMKRGTLDFDFFDIK